MNATRRLIEQARAILEPYFKDGTPESNRASGYSGAWLSEEDAQSLRRILRQLVQLTKGKA